MSDELAIINRIIEWHQTIRQHIKLVGDSLTDREALSSLQKSRADWVPGRLDILAEKRNKLMQVMSTLDEGLRNHFDYEEEHLPPILGELFTQALLIDHREIKKNIDQTKSIVSSVEVEGLGREECLTKEAEMQDVINNLCQTIEAHATKEEMMLEMLQTALLERQQDKG